MTDSDHNDTIPLNKLDRQLAVKAPTKVWTIYINYVWTLEDWLYVAVVIDLFSRQDWLVD
jgi:putative transposase